VYGTSIPYSSSTPSRSVAAGTAGVNVTASLGSLSPGRTYHYRLIATSTAGTTAGADLEFRTAPKPRPRAFSAKLIPRANPRRPHWYAIAGSLSLPSGLVGSEGCRGTVKVQATAGRSTLWRGQTGIGHACTYRLSVSLTGGHLPAHGRARIYVSFAGNEWLAGRPAAPLVVGLGY
jgi:hypothetical protein